MSRFNKPVPSGIARGPVETTGERTITYEGAPAYVRTAKSDLVLLALSNFVGQDAFYEKAGDRDDRFRSLVRSVASEDPTWMGGFVPWLRKKANMRTASVVAAAETAHTLLAANVPGARQVVDSALQRADEPAEFLAYWERAYGVQGAGGQYAPKLPMAVKRGIGDACIRLYTERSMLKYDTAGYAKRFGDVLEMVHPGDVKGSAQHLKGPWQHDLFQYAVGRAHGHAGTVPESLGMLRANEELRAAAKDEPRLLLSADALRGAGMTWEDAKSLGGELGLPSKEIWETMIPSMGYMALLRNLRNFDDAGIDEAMAQWVATKLSAPDEVVVSRQLPFRFYSAHKNVQSLRWGLVLEKALSYSAANVPRLPGRTLVCVDLSGSMNRTVSQRSNIKLSEVGALFGAITAVQGNEVTLVGYGTINRAVRITSGASALRITDTLLGMNVGWGTQTYRAVTEHYQGHDQVFVFTDEQSWGPGHYGGYGDLTTAVPANVPLFAFNLAGYAPSALDLSVPNRFAIGGFTDQLFALVERLLAGEGAKWPWEE